MEVFNFVKFITLTIFMRPCTSFESSAYLRVLKNKQLVDHDIYSVKNLKESQCLYECSLRDDCGSINYHAEQKICVLNNYVRKKEEEEEEERSFIDSTGWKYFEKSKTNVGELLQKNIYQSQVTQPSFESCKKIKENHPSAISESYLINLPKPTRVYCDMETDGGGWIRIGRVHTTTNEDVINFDLNSILSTSFNDMNKAASQNFLLSGAAYPILQSYVKFHEFRIFCTKPYHGRKNHASFSDQTTFKSKKFFDYLMGTYYQSENTCNALKYMPDDNSISQTSACTSSINSLQSSVDARFYKFIWYINAESHITLRSNSRMECDDYYWGTPGYNNFGTWLFYVR